jgi:hypothetical protein
MLLLFAIIRSLLFNHSLYLQIQFNSKSGMRTVNTQSTASAIGGLKQDNACAFPILIIVKTVYKNKARQIISSYCDLNTAKKFRSAVVAMAGKICGAINACLDLFITFGAMPKVNKRKLILPASIKILQLIRYRSQKSGA